MVVEMYRLLILLALILYTSGQAPGDHDASCRVGEVNTATHVFPQNWKVLVDTYDYTNLFAGSIPPPVWKERDVDGDSNNWDQLAPGSCQWNMRACTFRTAGQNNWLFSQYVSYEDAVEVYFNVTFDFYSCVRRSTCNKDYVTLYQYNRNSRASDAERTNPSNYQPLFGTVESSRIKQPSGATRQVSQNHTLTRPSNSEGFYLGIRDEGTCGDVIRIIVYYVVCPRRVEGLVTYPETALPVQNSSDIVFNAVCAPNAHNTTTLEVIASSSNHRCSAKATGGASCQCNAGYVLNSMSCEACSAGTYRTLNDGSCLPCPMNTIRTVVAAGKCNCINGFYRNDSPLEGAGVSCTAPPSACRNLEVVSTNDTTISIRWTQPEITGRSDFFYRVLHSDPDNIGQFIVVEDNLRDSNTRVNYIVSGLRPFTSYQLKVTTHNGVSDQDPDSHLRQSLVSGTTREGRPSDPEVQQLCTAIVWQTPSSPNGEIIGYDIEFSNVGQPTRLQNVNYYVTNEGERASSVTVKVRAVNGAGEGSWSPPGLTCPVQCEFNLMSISETSTSVLIEWDNRNTAVFNIKLSAPNDNDMFQQVASNLMGSNSRMSYNLTNLLPFTSYFVKLNDACEIAIRTAEGVSSPPSQFEALCTVLLWQPPMEPKGIITGYEIRYSSGHTVSLNSDNPYYKTTDREQVSELTVQIRAVNAAGGGAWTAPITNGCPRVCEYNLTNISETSTSVLIGWDNPNPNNAVFNIKLSDPNDDETFRLVASNLMGSNSWMYYNLTNLLPFTSYFVKLNDVCKIYIRTAEGVSSPPSQFESLCTVLLWLPPMEPKGIITGYEIRYSSGHTVSLRSNNPYYKTTNLEQVPNTVQIRAMNGAGGGTWTAPISNGCLGDIEDPNLTSISVTSTSVLIGWNNPNNAAFNIKLSDPNDNRTFRLIENNLMESNSRMFYNLTNLLPFTSYFVKLNDNYTIAIRTAEGASSPPNQTESLCNVLLWEPPMEPKGIITGYEIQYSSGHTVSLNSNNTYYKTTDGEQVPELTVQIRAMNAAGSGTWTEPISNGCLEESEVIGNGTQEATDTCDDLFEGDNVMLEILIIAGCTLAVTTTIFILVCVCICCCKGQKHKGEPSFKLNDYKI